MLSVLLAVLESCFHGEGGSDENAQVISARKTCGSFCMPVKNRVTCL